MAEKLFTNALTFDLEHNKIEIDEKKIYSLGISSARITNACLMAVVKECYEQQSTLVDVIYNKQEPQVIDIIAPKKGDKISINITEELNCLIKFAFQYSGNPEHDDKISILFNSKIVLENIDLFVEYVPEQIMHENSAYVDYDVRQAGSGKINLATGALRFNHSCGNDVNLVYNDWQTEKRSTTVYDVQGKKTKFRHGVGKGFKLSVEQFLIKRKGTENQSVYTYVDGDGNYHEFSEKYYYLNDKEQKVFVPKSSVQVDLNGKLKYVIDSKHAKEVKVERKTTNGLFLEQDCSGFKHAQYIEQRQQEQIELEENVDALKKQLKQYVIVNKSTGEKLKSGGELSKMFSSKTGKLSVASYESFLSALTADRLLLSESEAIQYASLLLQQTVKSDILTAKLAVDSSYNRYAYYSDDRNEELKKNAFKRQGYEKTLISLRQLVSDLRKDYAVLTKKSEYGYSNISNHYQYDAYLDYLQLKGYKVGNCCIDIDSLGRSGKLTKNQYNTESSTNLSIQIGHIKSTYCDLQLELERINDDLDSYYRKQDDKTSKMKVRQKVVEQRLRIFQQQFSDRTEKLQANINEFEAEINDFIEQMQGELTNRQIYMMLESSENNKVDLEKYFKQYYNGECELTQMNWQTPTYYVTGTEGETMGFNKDGYLVLLFDNYENQTTISYSKGRISSIKDPDNNVTSFEYGKNKRIKKIVSFDSKSYQLFYGKEKGLEGLLTKIVDGNGEETVLGYDKYGFLNSIEDNNRFGIQFVYDKYGRVVIVKRTSQIKSITADGIEPTTAKMSKTIAKINYHDSHLTTSVTDELGLVKNYNFDIVGKVVTMYEGEYSDPEETTRAKSFEYTDNKKSFSISDNISEKNLIANLIEREKEITLQGTKDNKPCEAVKIITVDKSLFEKGVTDYVFSVWAKADSAYVASARSLQYTNDKVNKTYNVVTDFAKQNRKFEVRAEVTYVDGETKAFIAGFDWLNTQWQYLAMPIEVMQGKKVSKCVIALDYSYNVKTAKFDCLSLREGSWTYNEFDEEGNKTYSEDSASRTHTKYLYDDNNRLVKEELTDHKGRVFTSSYEYNAQGTLVRSINYAGVVEETVFDEEGRALKKIKYNLDDPTSKFYEESKRDDKGVVTADIDESGEYDSVTYTYEQNDEVAVQTDGKGNKTAFGHKNGKLVSISGSSEGEESINTMLYTASLLTKASNGDTTYNYEYDGWGRRTNVKIAGEDFSVSTEYSDEFHSKTMFADNIVESETDAHGNTVKQTVKHGKNIEEIKNTYNSETGNVTESVIDIDGKTMYNIHYEYDHKGNTVKEARDGQFALTKELKYTADNDLQSTTYTFDKDITIKYTYETDHTPDRRDAKVVLPCGLEQLSTCDGLGRTKEIAIGGNLVKNIYYAKYGDHATNRVSSVWHGVNGVRKENTRYTYDKAGNIETITENGKLVARYAYDGLNRLVREDNKHFGTFTYQYDTAGNIILKTSYVYTLDEILDEETSVKEYSYKQHGWKDQLVALNGEQFEYNSMGNPTKYRDRILTWQGRRLLTYTKDGKSATYTYDVNGVRTSKTLKDGSRNFLVNYIYDGNNLIAEKRGSKWVNYFYGVDGVTGFEYEKNTYLYRKNVQGDITHIYKQDKETSSLELVAQYVYDAWGNHDVLDAAGKVIDAKEKGIGHMNPFRYRGYYFDIETQLYYLQTRYYDAEIGRFISSDSIECIDVETVGGLNLYAYCGNNPVMGIDPEGTEWWDWVIGAFTLALGIALCCVPGGQVFGVGLIVGGTSSLISASLDAAGVDSKTSSIITSSLSIVAGIALCFTPFAGIGAGLIGQGVGGLAGGFISEACGGSFTTGAAIGGFVGGIIGGVAYRGITNYRLSKMTPYQKGVMGEKYVKALHGNKAYKPTTGSNRPDLLYKDGSTLIEVKNVATQGYTQQLQRYMNMGVEKNIIYVRLGTKISTALKNSSFIIKYFPW